MSNYREDEFQRLSRVFKALSNPNRLRIFMRLASCCAPGTVCEDPSDMCRYVGELVDELSVSAPTVSHHLKELRDAGLIQSRRSGQNIQCWVDPEVLRALSEFFSTPLGE